MVSASCATAISLGRVTNQATTPAAGRGDRRGRKNDDRSPPRAVRSPRLPEGGRERAHVGMAVGGVDRHRADDDVLERVGDVVPDLAHMGARGGHVAGDHRLGRAAGEGRSSRQHLVQHAAQTVLVGPGVHRVPAGGLLGRHVVRGAYGEADLGQAGTALTRG